MQYIKMPCLNDLVPMHAILQKLILDHEYVVANLISGIVIKLLVVTIN